MFEKKCKNCGNKVERKFAYCPYCSAPLKEEIGHKGMLDENLDDDSIFGGMGMTGMPFQGLIGKLMKDVEKQMRGIDRMTAQENQRNKNFNPNIRAQGISVSVSTGPNGEPVIKVRGMGDGMPNIPAGLNERMPQQMPQKQIREKKMRKPRIPKEKAEKIANLPREVPNARVRRLSDRIVYEIELPNVKKEDVFIHRLGSSIEIKALAKNKAFFKLLPVSFPIIRHYMQDNKLILELKPEM